MQRCRDAEMQRWNRWNGYRKKERNNSGKEPEKINVRSSTSYIASRCIVSS
jgi:hypothetical protein